MWVQCIETVHMYIYIYRKRDIHTYIHTYPSCVPIQLSRGDRSETPMAFFPALKVVQNIRNCGSIGRTSCMCVSDLYFDGIRPYDIARILPANRSRIAGNGNTILKQLYRKPSIPADRPIWRRHVSVSSDTAWKSWTILMTSWVFVPRRYPFNT